MILVVLPNYCLTSVVTSHYCSQIKCYNTIFITSLKGESSRKGMPMTTRADYKREQLLNNHDSETWSGTESSKFSLGQVWEPVGRKRGAERSGIGTLNLFTDTQLIHLITTGSRALCHCIIVSRYWGSSMEIFRFWILQTDVCQGSFLVHFTSFDDCHLLLFRW